MVCLLLGVSSSLSAQEPSSKPAEKQTEKSAGAEKSPDNAAILFQIQLLETHVRFEQNGDSRKEVHTIVKLNNAVGAQQFSRLGFGYNRAFQRVEIPLVIAHSNGGTSDVLPSAISDAPNPAVEKYPAYQDVRVKSVRILGLQEGDTVEYRVVTTTTHHPLAPDFWLEHTFDRSGQVLQENYDLELPEGRTVQVRFNPNTPAQKSESAGDGKSRSIMYQWKKAAPKQSEIESASAIPDISISTFASWADLAKRLSPANPRSSTPTAALDAKAKELSVSNSSKPARMAAYYQFVRTEIKSVDLPLDAMGFQNRTPDEVLSSQYGTTAE